MNVMFNRAPRAATVKFTGLQPQPLKVAIVNNMPDSALTATQRQFTRLVMAATNGTAHVQAYHLPSLPRGEEARQYLQLNSRPLRELLQSQIDALIVTGNEPKTARLDQEACWQDVTKLADWARDNTRTTLWSCLAAHAAVLHLDGIERHRLPRKLSGVLSCQVEDDAVAANLPRLLNVCHSRLNEVRLNDLQRKGYDILSASTDGQADMFVKSFGSLFVFLQGHPEYEPDSLMREYRRDVGRYLRGERDNYPDMPLNYFNDATTAVMARFRTEAEAARNPELANQFPDVSLRHGLEGRLAKSANGVFRAWLDTLTSVPAMA